MEFNKKNVRVIIGLIIFTVLFVALVNNLPAISGVFMIMINLIFPFIVGGCIAFVINVPMTFFENKVYGRVKFLKKGKRGFSLITTILALVLVLTFVISLLVPEIAGTMKVIVDGVPAAANKVVEWVTKIGNDNEDIVKWISEISIDWKTYLESFGGMLKTGVQGIFSSAVGFVSGTVNVIFDLFVSVVFAIYILFRKEKLSKQGKQVIYAFLPEKAADRIIYILSLSYKTFKNFVTGQCTEAVILGMMFFISMSIFRMPYALLISVVIAVTALIPIFGAFFGCFIGAFLILFIDPMQAVWFVIMFLVLQQIEGNLIYPHVVGNSVGLPSIWVLVAVTVGGSLLGIAGMLLFIPLTSVLYALFREGVKGRLVKRNVSADKYEKEVPVSPEMLLSKENKRAGKGRKRKNKDNIDREE